MEDGLTGDVPAGALTVTLIDRNSGEQFPLNQKLQKDGRFAFFGAPETVFPLLANQDYPLKVEASADNYQTASFDFSVGPEAGQPEEVTRVMTAAGVEDTTVKVFNGGGLPVSGIVLILARNQVVLTGKVHESGDPFKGIAGALVEVLTSSQTVADGEGDFQMPQSLSASPMTLRSEKPTRRPKRSLVSLARLPRRWPVSFQYSSARPATAIHYIATPRRIRVSLTRPSPKKTRLKRNRPILNCWTICWMTST